MNTIKEQKTNYLYTIGKRILDILFSSVGLILYSPIFLLIATLIKAESPGPVFFRQERVGKNGRRFYYFRFRTMQYSNDDEEMQLAYLSTLLSADQNSKMKNVAKDPRITKIGGFLKRTSLDELPQLFNVLKGDMSLIGPRPPIPYEVELYDEWHKERLKAKPGITGLWQIQRDDSTFDEMVKLDIQYLRNPSLLADLKIILKTPFAVFKCDDDKNKKTENN
jgi:lipopolysaccharide/colanic/teichoic acid biosynthesis glycosyltransferase